MPMSAAEHAAASRRPSLVAPLALLVALVGLLATDLEAIDRGGMRAAVARDLHRVADLANLETGGAREGGRAVTMPVMVTQEGGPGWVVAEAEAAVEADPIFTRGEPHLLRVEVATYARTFGVRSQLWRQGWSLRAPDPLWVITAPWVLLLAVLAGAGVAGLRRRLTGGLVLTGVLAQALLLALPWPPGFVRPGLQQLWAGGPLGHWVVQTARGLPDASIAIGAGVVTLCAVLMIFDHRRSPGEGGGLVAAGLLSVLGLVVWLEAAVRAGLLPWLQQPAGWLALLGALGLWAWAWRRRELPVRTGDP